MRPVERQPIESPGSRPGRAVARESPRRRGLQLRSLPTRWRATAPTTCTPCSSWWTVAVPPSSPPGSSLRLTGTRSRADERHRLADPRPSTRRRRALPDLDSESQAWIERLSPQSPQRDAAIAALHAHLLKAARYEVGAPPRRASRTCAATTTTTSRSRAQTTRSSPILSKLDDFRGDSRFTTWAYKFALFEAGAKIRRRAWQGREVPLEPEGWSLLAHRGATPQEDVETAELLAALQDAMTDGAQPPPARGARRGHAQRRPDRRPRRATQHDPRRALQDHPRRSTQAPTRTGRPRPRRRRHRRHLMTQPDHRTSNSSRDSSAPRDRS